MDSSDPKDTGMSSYTTKVKRSARLLKKRMLKDNFVIEITDRLDDLNERGKLPCKILRSNKTKSKISVTLKNDSKKYNNRNSLLYTINASSKLGNVPNVQPSLNTVVDNMEKMPGKSLPKTFKNNNSSRPPIVTNVNNNVSTVCNVNTAEYEKSEDLVKSTRKRGRPSQKELQVGLRDATDKVNTSCKEVDRRKTRSGFSEISEESLDALYESDSTTLNEADRSSTPESNHCDDGSPRPKRKRIGTSTADVEIVDSCLPGTVKAVSTTTSEHDQVLDEPRSSCHETFDREVSLVSNRFNVPCDELRNIIERESVPVFREKYSDTVTLSMVTVSPVVSMTNLGKQFTSGWNSNGAGVEYKIEPIRESAAYEKTNLKDTMVEISKSMPSWSLSIVDDPPRYVITHMSIETYGTPVANKSVVLDRHFRASVYIDQRLEYKYCQRYTTASEIVNLIKALDAI